MGDWGGYIKINEKCKYPCRAVDKVVQIVSFLPIAHRSNQVFIKETIWQHGLLNKITIDKSGDNNEDIEGLKEGDGKEIFERN